MFERFDEYARRALFFARYHATQFGHESIEPAHLALGAIHSIDAIRLPALVDQLQQIPGWVSSEHTPLQVEIPFSTATKNALEAAAALATQLGHRSIRATHLLAAVMNDAASPITAILREMGVDPDQDLARVTDNAGDRSAPWVPAIERDTVVAHVHLGHGLEGGAGDDESQIRAVADELFIATDQKDWTSARAQFSDGDIDVDMTSLAGGVPLRMTADDLIAGFRVALHAGKTSHHLVANYRVTVDRASAHAELFAHGYAWNRVVAWPPGEDLWETWGTYRMTLRRLNGRWRIDGFRYDSKLTRGNDAVPTQTDRG